ncbi:MAG: hypothetical protein LBC74_14530 [Planctomycetaceae bacterium]|jgi:hypothetical protein|nr:hypothetical protein [Planctomycetaceae bacterium]
MKEVYLFFVLLLLWVIIGCNNLNPQGRISVSGDVTFDGKPLVEGEIYFSSISGTLPNVSTGSIIKDGKFSLSAEHGLIPGQTYSVQFRSVVVIDDSTKNTTDDPQNIRPTRSMPETRDIIPRKYGIDSKETITATNKAKNVFHFDLTTDTKP